LFLRLLAHQIQINVRLDSGKATRARKMVLRGSPSRAGPQTLNARLFAGGRADSMISVRSLLQDRHATPAAIQTHPSWASSRRENQIGPPPARSRKAIAPSANGFDLAAA